MSGRQYGRYAMNSRGGAYTNGGGGGYGDSTNQYESYSSRRYDYGGDDGYGTGYGTGYGGGGGGGGSLNTNMASERYDRPRRPGGYGDMDPMDSGYQDSQGGVQRPTSLERRRANRRSGDRWGADSNDGSRSRSRGPNTRAGYTDGSRQIEEVLEYIKRDWNFMTEDQCVPVQVALKLLDTSSLGLAHRHRQFENTYHQLQGGLKAIVNEHHQGFNSSIGTFHKIQSSLRSSQQRANTLREGLVEAKSNLSATKPELQGLSSASQNYDDMLQTLATIEQLQLVSEKLEGKISEKRFLSAVEILQDALRMIRKSEMEDIGALSDLRVYLSNQEHSLTDILIEELHNHLYLKSPYCEDRWKSYAQNQIKSSTDEGNAIDSRSRGLYEFLDQLEFSENMTDDLNRNPEADTFHYIQLIVEALSRMSRLEIAVDTIEQRLPVELFKVVEKSNNEVAQRHPTSLRAHAAKTRGKPQLSFDEDESMSIVLNDLLWTLYARFEAIAEGHRVVHDVIAGIAKRDGSHDVAPLTRGFKELWKLYQSEMRSLLHDYLATEGDTYRSGQGQLAGGTAFQKSQRDKNKRIFTLNDIDTKSSELASEKQDLEIILKSSVPGLVSDSKQPEGFTSKNTTITQDGSAIGHRLLIEPSVFNMAVLLRPSLNFLNRLKQIVPRDSDIVMSTLTSFLDDFLVNVFHPQLDETVVDMCALVLVDVDAFQMNPNWASKAKKPIFSGTSKFFDLVVAFCRMLDNLPHDQVITQLIINQMTTYYDKICGWYKALVSRSQVKGQSGNRYKASANFAEDSELHEILSSLLVAPPDAKLKILEQEVSLLIAKSDTQPLEEADLMLEQKSIAGLCLLYNSMKWLASKINRLRVISNRATDSSQHDARNSNTRRRWTLVTSSSEAPLDETSVYLPLNKDTANMFDSVILAYREVAKTILETLHFEIRFHCMRSLRSSLQSNYNMEQLSNELDPEVNSLNTSIASFDEQITNNFLEHERSFITSGIGLLVDTYLLQHAPLISHMNDTGCARMQLNILVLQQNLKTVEPGAQLARSAAFFDFFMAGPEAMVERARQCADSGGSESLGFSYDEMKTLMELRYSERLNSPRHEISLQAKRALDDQLLQLSEYLWQQ